MFASGLGVLQRAAQADRLTVPGNIFLLAHIPVRSAHFVSVSFPASAAIAGFAWWIGGVFF
jgi:hypothetical protein